MMTAARPHLKRSSLEIAYVILRCLAERKGGRKTEIATLVSLNGRQIGSYFSCMQEARLVVESAGLYSLTDKGSRALFLMGELLECVGRDTRTLAQDVGDARPERAGRRTAFAGPQ